MNCNHREPRKKSFTFHFNPFELFICGKCETNRTRFAARIASLFTPDREVGQVIGIRSPERDSDASMGINLVRSAGQHGLLYPEAMDTLLHARPLLDADLVIVESSDEADRTKLVCINDYTPDSYEHVLAFLGESSACPILPASANYFAYGQSLELKAFLDDYFANQIEAVPLYGLVLAGGKSVRMQTDKALLAYHGVNQVAYCHELLRTVCDQVFVSVRPDQRADGEYLRYEQIADSFLGFGPLGGILSAQKAYPEAAWLVLACDLPYVTESTIEQLVTQRNPFKLATAYQSATDGFPEPLCAIYEPKSVFRLMHFLALGYHCPRKVLINSDTWLLQPRDVRALANVNTPEERECALRELANETPR